MRMRMTYLGLLLAVVSLLAPVTASAQIEKATVKISGMI